jgi:TolA protein
MKLPTTARIRRLFDRYPVRLTIGIVLSLLLHAFILSLQLGYPGLGLPGLALPWSERRAQTPQLSIRIANPVISPTAEQMPSPPPVGSEVEPKPQEAAAANDQALTELPNARVKQAPARAAPVSPSTASALKSSPAFAQAKRKNGTPPPEDQSAPPPARTQTEVIALSGNHPESFTVPAPDLDNWWRPAPKVDNVPLPVNPPQQAAQPAIAMQSRKQTSQQSQEPAPALQKPSEQESFERPEETKAKEPEPSKTPELATEVAERKQGEEIAAQDAARKAEEQEAAQRAQDAETRKLDEARKTEEATRQIAAKKLEQEQATQREAQAAEKKLEEEKQKKLAEAERQEKELAAHKQAEEVAQQQATALALQKQKEEAQREESKRQEQAKAEQQAAELAARRQAEEEARKKATAIEKRKQEEQLAAQQKEQELAAQQAAQQRAQELAARQKADAEAAMQRENGRAAAAVAAKAAAGNANSNAPGTQAGASGNGNGNQTKGSGAGNLASRALEQVGKIDLSRIAPIPGEAENPEEDHRRHSFLGMIDHDVVVDAYIRSWRTKIERNGALNYSQSAKDRARQDPVVTVAIRSDGSVEDIIINRSSGERTLDEAVKRIVAVNAPYSVFPESLARKYPVIEIRRVWNFDETLRLLEEVR